MSLLFSSKFTLVRFIKVYKPFLKSESILVVEIDLRNGFLRVFTSP